MNSFQHILRGIKLSSLKKFTALLSKSRIHYADALAQASVNRDKFEKFLPADFSWAYLYELEVKEMFFLNLAAFGFLDKLFQAQRNGFNLNQYLMDESIREAESEDDDVEWSGGHGGIFSKGDVLAISHASQNSWRCLGIYGHYLNDLVKQVRDGNDGQDNAFFHAVSIDRTTLSCPTFSARHARAEYFGEKKFMLRLRKAVKGKPHDALLLHQDLRSILQLFHEMNTLSQLTLTDADLLFIKELRIYQDAGNDPARSLMRFIQRWKAEKPSAT